MAAKPAPRATGTAAHDKPQEAPEDAPEQAPATTHPTPPPAAPEPRSCLCGCGGAVASKRGLFRPGHDARVVGQLVRAVIAGEMTEAQALERIAPASDLLKAKVTRSIKLHLDRAAKRVSADSPRATENVSA